MADKQLNNMPKADASGGKEELILSAFQQYQEKSAVDAGGFLVASMNDCLKKAKELPPLKVLFPNVVLEGDLCILFGQSGIGKTIFAMQIAREIAAQGYRVLYIDFEMTLRQLVLRYESTDFPSTFFRAEIDKNNLIEDVLKGIEQAALANYAEVVFIDNITALGQSLDKGSDAGTLMAALNTLKKQYNWTLVVLNHVPKAFCGAIPLSLSAIQGSAKLNQLVDDAIGIGQSSKDPSIVYVKQCKWRNGETILDPGHVALYERGKNACGNLCFTFVDFGIESEHLMQENSSTRDALRAEVIDLLNSGMTQQQVADKLHISQSKVSRLLKDNG